MQIRLFYKFSLILFFICVGVTAQDTQYWNKQYGTYGELLGGTVVGGVSDLSSTYYNPGAMAFAKDTTLILSTSSIQFIFIDRKDVGGTNIDLESSSVLSSPSFFALRIPLKGLGNNQLAASYITRYSFRYEADGSQIDEYVNSSPDENQSYNSNGIFVYQDLSEYWPGFTWSTKLSSNIGFGATLYIPIRNQSGRLQTLVQNYDSQTGGSSFTLIQSNSYFNVRMLLKLGMVYHFNRLMLGFSITTPSVSLFGNGSASINISNTNLDSEIDDRFPELASNYQEDLPTLFKSPVSIGFGAAYYFDKTVLYFSAEWFNEVSSFNIMDPDDFQAQSSGETLSYNLSYELNSVFNFGFGIKHIFSENFTFFGGIINDESAYVPGSNNKFAISNWDIVHIRSGGEFNIDNLSIALGLGYGFSGKFLDRISIFKNDNSGEDNINFQEIDIVFGLSYKI